jgi:hypothetical protein
MAGCCDCNSNSHSPANAAHCAQVDCVRLPPVNGILWIYCMEDRGLIHVDCEGGQSIPFVDDGKEHLEESKGLVTHFLGWALRGVHSHAIDEAIFAIKQEIVPFCTERVLSEKAGLNLQAFLIRHRQETRIPLPRHLSTKETSCW